MDWGTQAKSAKTSAFSLFAEMLVEMAQVQYPQVKFSTAWDQQ